MESPGENNHHNFSLPTVTSSPSVWSIGLPGSQQQLVRVPKQSLQASRKRLELAVAISILVIFILFTSLCVSIYFNAIPSGTRMCMTPQCVKSASNLLDSMDPTVNPCDDFYKFTCGKWNKEHFIKGTYDMNDWFVERGWLGQRDVLDYLRANDSSSEPEVVHKARLLFRTCQDFDSMETEGLPMVWKLLNRIGLPDTPSLEKKVNQPWIKSLSRSKKFLNLDYLIGFGIMSKPSNKTINKLAIATANDVNFVSHPLKESRLELELRTAFQRGDETIIKIWTNYAAKIIEYYLTARNKNIDGKRTKIESLAKDVIVVMREISDMERSENASGLLYNEIPEEMTVRELQRLVDNATTSGKSKIRWESFFTYLYEDTGIDLEFNKQDTILVYKRAYFEMLSNYLEKVDDSLIELCIWFHVIYNLASHTNEELADIKHAVSSKVFHDMYSKSRTSLCSEAVYKLMTVAVSYQVTQMEGTEEKKKKILDMLERVQKAFLNIIRGVTWMENQTKHEVQEKIRAVLKFVAYPEWMNDPAEVNSYYDEIEIEENKHLSNVLNLLESLATSDLLSLREVHDSLWPNFEPLDVNAYYNPNDNSITVPLGLIQFPFYGLGLEALNYGAIGTILGHELTHGFDNTGRKYDKEGNYKHWWSNESVREYTRRTECFIQQYNNVMVLDEQVDGNFTLGENLADDGGLRDAFYAYQDYVKEFGPEPFLPGLQMYNHNQLFFLTYGNMWCSQYTEETLFDSLEEEHSPNFVRAKLTVQNFPEYAKAWGCPSGSPMNPVHKCSLWTN